MAAALLCCVLHAADAQTPRTIRFAAEEWPPFVTPTLPEDGMSGSLMHAVFDKLGYTVRIDYFPWRRTFELGRRDPRYAGVAVVYHTAEREAMCHFSVPIASTLVVLVSLKEQPVRASRIGDLRGVRIGTVAGYSNGDEFDTLAHQGQIEVEEGVNDETNLRKLLVRRFPAIVIERRVLRHLLASRLAPAERERIVVDERPFRERPMHICFKKSPEGLVQQRAFNDAARGFDFVQMEKDYWRRIGQQGGGNPDG